MQSKQPRSKRTASLWVLILLLFTSALVVNSCFVGVRHEGCWHEGWRGPEGYWHPGHWGPCR
ncbi:MAG TPA: hypothetical protein VNZ54_07720 [bacterium]|nr:hypothetical protein [bacterium]